MDKWWRWNWLGERLGRGFPSDWFMIAVALFGALLFFGFSRSFELMSIVVAMMLWIPGLIIIDPAMVLIGCTMKYFMWTRAESLAWRIITAILGCCIFWGYLEIAIPYF